MSVTFLREVIATACEGHVPPLVDEVLDWPIAARHLDAFPAGPILVLDAPRPSRAFVANVGLGAAFDARVVAALPDPQVAAFLAGVPAHTRRMLDTDGATTTLYLDDLHDVDHGLDVPDGHALLCATLAWPSGERTTITRHGAPPRHLLPPPWQRQVDDVLHAGLTGLWAVRWQGDTVHSLLWINDARWRGDPEQAARVLDARFTARGDTRWATVRALAQAAGWRAYPDGIELHGDGGWDVTAGFVPLAQGG